ncbi:reverse transcriptase domain-containing protein [Tanacetum coccineum]
MIPTATLLVGFSGEIIWPLGKISLFVKIGDEEHSTSTWMNFMVVRSPSPFNGIIGRPRVRRIQAVPSTTHGMLKFPITEGTITLRSSRIILLECIMVSEPGTPQPVIDQVKEEKIQHRLNIREGCLLVRQKKIWQAPERSKAICEEVEKLVEAGIMKEVHYHGWLSNPVMGTFLGYKVDADGLRVSSDKGPEVNYTPMEKLILALILSNPEVTRRLLKWRFELEKHDIHYRPRTFNATNNEAEYEDLIAGLRIAEQIGVKNLQANVDSKLVANQKKLQGKGHSSQSGKENYVLREIHKGSCSMHAGSRSVVAKSLRSGYYWPTMHADARKLIRECSSSGPFPKGPGKVKFLIVAMDYFTKWIEAKLVATITGAQVKKFVWDNTICRFGLPGEIISDNRKQFKDNPFKDWCEKLCIRQCFASVKHPQANGLVERENRSLSEGIKASNEETPFSLTYDTETVIPVEIGMPTLRTAEVDMIKNNEALEVNLDHLEERREHAAIQEAKSKANMEKYYNARVRSTRFRPGDIVYRSNEASRAEDGGKLGPKWE